MVRGYHEYQDIWMATSGERLMRSEIALIYLLLIFTLTFTLSFTEQS